MKNIDIHPVTVLKSTQFPLIEEYIEKLRENISASFPKLLFEGKHLDDTPFPEILREAKTFPMFYEKKLIVVKGYDKLGKNDLDLLMEYATSPASFSFLVLISQESKKTRRSLGKNIKLVDLDRGNVIDREIVRIAKNLGMDVSPRAVNFIKTTLGEDISIIKNELEKISFYIRDNRVIEEKDLKELMEKRSEETVFSLSTAVSNRDLRSSFKILKELEKSREDPVSILYMMAWRFRQIFKVSQLLNEGKSDEVIAKAIKTSRGAVFYIKKSARNFKEDDFGKILNLLEETDYKIKNSSTDKYILIEKLLIDVCK